MEIGISQNAATAFAALSKADKPLRPIISAGGGLLRVITRVGEYVETTVNLQGADIASVRLPIGATPTAGAVLDIGETVALVQSGIRLPVEAVDTPEAEPVGIDGPKVQTTARALSSVLSSASKGDNRFALEGVHITSGGSIMASDTHRLSLHGAATNDRGIIVPLAIAELAADLFADDRGIVIRWNASGSRAEISGEAGALIFRPIDGQFPRVADVIPGTDKTTALFTCARPAEWKAIAKAINGAVKTLKSLGVPDYNMYEAPPLAMVRVRPGTWSAGWTGAPGAGSVDFPAPVGCANRDVAYNAAYLKDACAWAFEEGAFAWEATADGIGVLRSPVGAHVLMYIRMK